MKNAGMSRIFFDQMNREVELSTFPPRRIVSLVPSQTELLFDLGLNEEVAGLTKFCIHPEEKWRSKPRIGGTKKVDFDKITALQPDLIIGNKEENDRSQIEELTRIYPVWMSDITTLEDAFEMMKSVGEITGKAKAASNLVGKIRSAFQFPITNYQLPHLNGPAGQAITAAYLIWRRPWMAAAPGTFIDSMMTAAGFQNIFSNKTRYPEITLEELSAAKPQVVMLSSEPYPFKEKHIAEIKEHCPESVVRLVDGELYSWYGSRMLLAAPYFANLQTQISHAL